MFFHQRAFKGKHMFDRRNVSFLHPFLPFSFSLFLFDGDESISQQKANMNPVSSLQGKEKQIIILMIDIVQRPPELQSYLGQEYREIYFPCSAGEVGREKGKKIMLP